MSQQQSSSSSSEHEFERNFLAPGDQDREVDDLFQTYSDKIKFIENYADATDEMRENCQEVAQKSLFTEIQRLPDPNRAMERIHCLLENRQGTTDVNEISNGLTQVKIGEGFHPQGSDVEFIETASSNRISSPDHGSETPEMVNYEDTVPEIPQNLEDTPTPVHQNHFEPEHQLAQLFDITENGETVFNRDVLDSLCAQIGERPVAIISTAGKFRQGKTFWKNVMLNGLQKNRASYSSDDYIGGRGGIRFQSGYERHTKGIMVWPKVFDRKDKDGNDIAVILMDTQGTFDTCSDIADSAVIFAISLLMSSVKIFNTKNQIDAQDLDSLNVFISFSQRTDVKAGQHFILMMRDALDTGLQPEYIANLKRQARRAPELSRLLDGVFDAFEKVDCYMVPRPSVDVLRANGEIRAGDCGDDFLAALCGCANHILDNLVAKKVMGTELTGSTLKQYVENLVDHIRDNHHKAIGSAFAATSQLYFERARAAANETFAGLYEMLVRTHNHRPIKPEEYDKEIRNILEETFKEYNNHPLFGSNELKEKEFEHYKQSLLDRCHEKAENNQQRFRDVQMADGVNGAYETYEREMKPDFLENLLGNKDQKVNYVNERHANAYPSAMDHFENAVADFGNEEELVSYKRDLLKDMIMLRYNDLQNDNAIVVLQSRVGEIFTQLGDEYKTLLKEQVPTVKKLDDVESIVERCQNLQRVKYGLKKAEFLSETSANFPNIDSTMLDQMLDNYRDSVSVEFRKCEDDFEANVRTHLNMEKLKAKMEGFRAKQQETQRKFNEEKKKTTEQIKTITTKLEQEKRARETAEKDRSSGMQPLMIMMKEMNESSQRQFELMRADREERERRERLAAEERAHHRQIEMEMLRQEREEREKREEMRENRRNEIETRRREEERIRQEAAERLRQAEERRRQEAAAAAQKQQKPQPCSIM